MLNELLLVERGARQAGLSMPQLHPDVKECGRVPTLVVKLDERGEIASLQPVPPEVRLWTLRDGQQNSFPFVKPKRPLLSLSIDDERRRKAVDRKSDGRRGTVLGLAEEARLSPEAVDEWFGEGLLNRLRERRKHLEPLTGTEARVVPDTIDRFLQAWDRVGGGGSEHLLQTLIERLTSELRHAAQSDWLEAATGLLLGKFDAKKGAWECSGALLFDAAGSLSITDPRLAVQVSRALSTPRIPGTSEVAEGICNLTGQEGPLLSGNFPQPNLPVLGQTYIFAKNTEIRANDRYGRFAADAMHVGQDTAIRLAAAIRALTDETRRNVTWRAVPGEAPKQSDLLLAFVEEVLEAPAAGALAELDADEDYSEEDARVAQRAAGSIAAFEKRTERLIEAVRGKVGGNFRQTPVRVAIFRRVDQANRKVVYAGSPTIAEVHDAAVAWAVGERNAPPWLTLPVLRKGENKPRPMAPPHIAPLGLIPFSKQLFTHGGTKSEELVGLPAAEALALFFSSGAALGLSGQRQILRILRLVLRRRGALVAGTAQAQRRGFDAMKNFDRREALRTITMLGLLLHKLGRTKEVYMKESAFKLGQLLAAADAVHAGYCADVRGGDVPPSLLGNQVFTMAQTAPGKALATLCRRWKPYDGWAKKAGRERQRIDALVESKKPGEQQRGWAVRVALRHAREMSPLADELAASLATCVVDDTFRAELLLGYIAGLPKSSEEENSGIREDPKTIGKEDEA